MMDSKDFVLQSIDAAMKDLESKYEISEILKDIAYDIEVWDHQNALFAKINELNLVINFADKSIK